MSADGLVPGEVTKCVQRYEELQALHGQLQTCLVVVSAELKGLRALIDQLIGSERKAGVGIHRDLTSTKQLLTSVESMLGGGEDHGVGHHAQMLMLGTKNPRCS